MSSESSEEDRSQYLEQTKANPEPESEPESKPESKSKPEPKPESEPESKPEPKPKSEQESKSELRDKRKMDEVRINTAFFGELSSDDWLSDWVTVNHGKIVKTGLFKSSRELICHKEGYGEIEINLQNSIKVAISVICKSQNDSTLIEYKSPDDVNWQIFQIPVSKEFKMYTFALPDSFKAPGSYRFRIGTKGENKKKSVFRQIQIIQWL